MVDWATTDKTRFNRYLTYDIQTVNRTNSPYQTITSYLGMLIGENPYCCYLGFSRPQHRGVGKWFQCIVSFITKKNARGSG